ncbi:penicillin-binding transpeptidase domain-containing protein [Nocardioides bigeumensis]|uniref:Penicillin-binding transpeptidase domain-containing protein n=1 Tax=Nocardioides bigeumensis TaxID=433657 RepID=A0ABN2YYW3_9ACTN
MRISVATVALLTALVSGVTACTGSDEPDLPEPDAVVEALATGLESGDLSGVPFVADTAEDAADLPEIVELMGSTPRTVTGAVGDVRPDADAGGDGSAGDTATATATLTWVWDVTGDPEQEWTYDAPVALALVDGEWQVEWDRKLVEPSLGAGTVLDLTHVRAARGAILGPGQSGLISARPVTRFGIDKSRVPLDRAVQSARELAALLDIAPGPYAEDVEAAGEKAFVEAIVLRREDVPSRVAQAYLDIPGAAALAEDLHLGPTRDFALPLLGRVGPVTAEMIEDDPDRYEVGDVVGTSGLEARYDEQLTGTDGVLVEAVASDGKERELFRIDAVDGDPLTTTMDVELQLTAERLLADTGPAAALVAIRPSTGAVLVAANGPGTKGANIATFGQAAPGSTFKTVSSLALLRSGVRPDDLVDCPASVVVDGRAFENYDDYPPGGLGRIPFRSALANSCNTAFIGEHDKIGGVGNTVLADAAASLGLGIDHDLGFPAYFGQVPPPETETEAAADLIGQGTVLASPMVMATVMASIQSGTTVVPRLLDQVEVSVPEQAPPLTGGEAEALRSMLRSVVTSGSGVGLLDVPGPPVIAKTGTAEFDLDGKRLLHAWMVAAQGDLAVAVYVDIGESGSRTAGPILEAFLRAA